jgi:HEAT repeat protein
MSSIKPVILLACHIFVVLVCLATYGLSQDLNTLSEHIRSGNVEEKREALFQIRNLRSPEASRVAVPALHDNNEIVRATAAASVIFLPKAEAVEALLPLLKDGDEFVRREGATALGDVADPEVATGLIDSVNRDKSPEVRSAAAAALGKTGNPIAVRHLIAILEKKPTEETELLRRSSARSVGQIAQIMRSGKLIVVTPQNFLPEKYKDIGAKPSPDLLSHFHDAVPVLIRVLENKKEANDTRREAAFALGAIGDRSAEPVIAKYAAGADIFLAEICKEALMKMHAAGS